MEPFARIEASGISDLLTLRSSGRAELLHMVSTALSQLPLTIIVATAGRIAFAYAAANVFIAD